VPGGVHSRRARVYQEHFVWNRRELSMHNDELFSSDSGAKIFRQSAISFSEARSLSVIGNLFSFWS
jgi:hypothetical protein